MKLRIAELNIEVFPRDPYTERFCQGFLAEFEVPDLTVQVTEDEVQAELRAAAQEQARKPPSYGSAECICIYRRIALALPAFEAFVFHSSVLEYEGVAYAFAARSGTGKSTHTALWLQTFEGARVINGDKPILRRIGGVWRAFGTPWCGKERYGCNASAPLAAICFLERAAENRIASLAGENILPRLFDQVIIPTERESADRFLDLLADMVEDTPCFLLSCNMEKEAASVAYAGMQAGRHTKA